MMAKISTAGFVGPRGRSYIADILGASTSDGSQFNGAWSSWREDLLAVQRILLDERIAAAAVSVGVTLEQNRLVTVCCAKVSQDL
jgi:hypothetical protein